MQLKSPPVPAQFSMLPTLNSPGGDAELELRAFQGIVRWFPFRGSFFIGSGIGYQIFKASITQTVSGGRLRATADLSDVFVSPQVGWLWTWQSGLALGIGLGAQVPFAKDPAVPVTYNGQPVPDHAGGGISSDVINSAREAKDQVSTLAKLVNKYPIPNLDLLRVGFFF